MDISTVLNERQLHLIKKMLTEKEFSQLEEVSMTINTKEEVMAYLEGEAMYYGLGLILSGEGTNPLLRQYDVWLLPVTC